MLRRDMDGGTTNPRDHGKAGRIAPAFSGSALDNMHLLTR